MKKEKITIMCEFCEEMVWLNDYMLEENKYPEGIKKYESELKEWKKSYDELELWKKKKNLNVTIKMLNFIKTGFELSKKIQEELGDSYDVYYYDEILNRQLKLA